MATPEPRFGTAIDCGLFLQKPDWFLECCLEFLCLHVVRIAAECIISPCRIQSRILARRAQTAESFQVNIFDSGSWKRHLQMFKIELRCVPRARQCANIRKPPDLVT